MDWTPLNLALGVVGAVSAVVTAWLIIRAVRALVFRWIDHPSFTREWLDREIMRALVGILVSIGLFMLYMTASNHGPRFTPDDPSPVESPKPRKATPIPGGATFSDEALRREQEYRDRVRRQEELRGVKP